MSSQNAVRGLFSAIFKAGSETILHSEESISAPHKFDDSPLLPEDVYLGPTPWLDQNTYEPWEPPSLKG